MFSWFFGASSLTEKARQSEKDIRAAQYQISVTKQKLLRCEQDAIASAKRSLASNDMAVARGYSKSAVHLRRRIRGLDKQNMELVMLQQEAVSVAVEPLDKQKILTGVAELLTMTNKRIKSTSLLSKQQKKVAMELSKMRIGNELINETMDSILEDDDVSLEDEADTETDNMMRQLSEQQAMETVDSMPKEARAAQFKAPVTPIAVVNAIKRQAGDESPSSSSSSSIASNDSSSFYI